MTSCQKMIDVTPIATPVVVPPVVQTPDFNFMATSPYDFLVPSQNAYLTAIELYNRPFSNVNDSTEFVLSFTSSNFSTFVIQGDTLRSGDKIKLRYSDFKNYRLGGVYYSSSIGTHLLTFNLSSEKASKSSQITLKTL